MTLGRHDLLVSVANEAYLSVWPRHRKMGLMFVFWPSLSDVGKSAFFAPGRQWPHPAHPIAAVVVVAMDKLVGHLTT